MTDPTPRTAATARTMDEWVLELLEAVDRAHYFLVEHGAGDIFQFDPLEAIRTLLAAAEAAGRVAALEDWQHYAGSLSDALLAMGHHSASRHQSPSEYDAESGLACGIAGCLSETVEALDFAGPTFPLAAPAPTPSEPVARCVGEHDWETRHPGDLAVCRRCWTVESDATPAPTPSEPEERCGYEAFGKRCTLPPHDGNTGHLLTPATRDE